MFGEFLESVEAGERLRVLGVIKDNEINISGFQYPSHCKMVCILPSLLLMLSESRWMLVRSLARTVSGYTKL